MSRKIVLLTCYMGTLPDYFPYFAASCNKNPDIDFIVFNDRIGQSEQHGNLRIVKITFDEFNRLASQKLGLNINISNGYKIADFKPVYAMVFDNFIEGYDFWGYVDLDIIWGNLRHFITDDLLDNYDVITTKEKWIAGHFTIFRNTPFFQQLITATDDYKQRLEDPTYNWFIEESCRRWLGEQFSLEYLQANKMPVSIYDIVMEYQKQGKLRFYCRDVIREYPQVPINYLYNNGVFTDLNNGQEFMYFHLLTIKKLWRFYMPAYKKIPEKFFITGYGVRSYFGNKWWWMAQRTISCVKGLRSSLKKQPRTDVMKKLLRMGTVPDQVAR